MVCPPKLRGLRHGVFFFIAAVDNLDHNPTSAPATDSFHGTGISSIQHLSHEWKGCDCVIMVIDPNTSFFTPENQVAPPSLSVGMGLKFNLEQSLTFTILH